MKHLIITYLFLFTTALFGLQAYLGIYVTIPSSEDLKKAELTFGVMVETIMPGSPADVYDIHENDIIYGINNRYIRNESDLHRFMSEAKPDDSIYVLLMRENQPHIKQIQLRKREELYRELYIFNYIQNPWLFIGIDVEQVSAQLARLLNLEAGMVILTVRENSIASLQGIEAGDIIISINSNNTYNIQTLTEAMNNGLQNQPMQFYIWRNSTKITKLVDLSNSLSNDINSNEVVILGPDVFNNELYSYPRDMINKLLDKPKSVIESDIERLEHEIFMLRQRIEER